MNSAFGEVFLFLTDLAWKSRVTIPVLVTTLFLIMDIRLQIEINIRSGQAAAEIARFDDSDEEAEEDANDADEEYTTDGSSDDELSVDPEDDSDFENTASRIRRSLGLS